jgi:hypothetical protein
MVEQVDRDAAAEQYLEMLPFSTEEGAKFIRNGKNDELPLVQAFAAHRIAAEARGKEAAARIASEHAATWGKRWREKEDEGDKPDIYQHGRLAGLSDGAATVATAIRASIGQEHSSEVERLHHLLREYL